MCTPQNEALAALFLERRASLLTRLQRRFPRTCSARVEDALSQALIVALTEPERFERLDAPAARERVAGFLYTVAWRQLRGHHRRHATRAERGVPSGLAGLAMVPAEQDALVEVHLRLPGLVRCAALRWNTKRADALTLAVLYRLASGCTDSDAARRHGVSREHVNHVRREVRSRLFDGEDPR